MPEWVAKTEWVEIVALILGPVLAVALTLWREASRQERERKFSVMRLLLTTRTTAADPAFTTAVNLIPIEFGHVPSVMTAWEAFVHAANKQAVETGMIDQVLKAIMLDLGFSERAASQVAREPYFAKGLGLQQAQNEAVAKGIVSLARSTRAGAHASLLMTEHIIGKPIPPLPEE